MRHLLPFLLVFAYLLPQQIAARREVCPDKWEAGSEVEATYPSDGEWFVAQEIPDSIFSLMRGKSYKIDCTIPREELRYLQMLHKDADGRVLMGEMVCHKDVAPELLEIFATLYREDYPIERMVLIDHYDADDLSSMLANNTSCFNFRKVAGSNKLSAHSKGKAVDINPLYNPYVKKRKNGTLYVSPEEGRPYIDRQVKKSPYMLMKGDAAYNLFLSKGYEWGGGWKSLKDYQHFEK